MKFHIAKDGSPSACDATQKACPLGGEHFNSEKEAYEHLASTHDTVPEPVKDPAKIIEDFNAGKSFSLSDLLGVVDHTEIEKKKEERREAFEAAKAEEAKAAVVDPSASKRLLIDKTKQLNDERTTLTNHTEKVARAKLVNDLMAIIRRGDAQEIDKALKSLGDDEEKDIKPVTPVAPVKGSNREVLDRLEKEQVEADKAKRLEEGRAKLDQIWQDIDLGKDPFAKMSESGALRPEDAEFLAEQRRIADETAKIMGPEPDSFGKVFEDAISQAGAKLREASERSNSGRTAKELKTMLIAKLIKEL